ncbi:hypothetical protein [Paenibacillus sp. NEAU-GSW1]|uniref:hypothetical protein n=1 Tax=Paenibacillus sp. NEAU-GSW1 TaxID=2682486 RepID=UPI0012E11F95|nr:hypothetical protein [Paenibacillus sp. NEAU-GSW1]MUT66472.1 hypothetical protein [Paenibacillus sp. NEAU-GSW1]
MANNAPKAKLVSLNSEAASLSGGLTAAAIPPREQRSSFVNWRSDCSRDTAKRKSEPASLKDVGMEQHVGAGNDYFAKSPSSFAPWFGMERS